MASLLTRHGICTVSPIVQVAFHGTQHTSRKRCVQKNAEATAPASCSVYRKAQVRRRRTMPPVTSNPLASSAQMPGSGIGPTSGGWPAGWKALTNVAVPSMSPITPGPNCVALVRIISMSLVSPGSILPVPLVPGSKLNPTTPSVSPQSPLVAALSAGAKQVERASRLKNARAEAVESRAPQTPQRIGRRSSIGYLIVKVERRTGRCLHHRATCSGGPGRRRCRRYG